MTTLRSEIFSLFKQNHYAVCSSHGATNGFGKVITQCATSVA